MIGRPDLRRVARPAVDAVLVGLAVAVLVVLALGRLVPLTGGSTLVVTGGSMVPAVPLGAAVVTTPVAPPDVAEGDIVSIRTDADSAIYTHRVVRVVDRGGEQWLETRGDANPAADPALVPATLVVGRVAVTVPYAGYVLWLLSTPPGVLFVVSLAATLLVAGRILEPGPGGEEAVGEAAEMTRDLVAARGPG